MLKTSVLFLVAYIFCFSCSSVKQDTPSALALASGRHYIDDYPAVTAEGSVNVVVEIPAGTLAKWEVNKLNGELEWERINEDSLRIVEYLAYPANYGMIPQTLLPKESGGDGDPLDVVVLGEAIERGSIVSCKLIGVLELSDNGEQDDKLIAIPTGTYFDDVNDVDELEQQYPGIITILNVWFENYKGERGNTEAKSVSDKSKAETILKAAMKNYQKQSR